MAVRLEDGILARNLLQESFTYEGPIYRNSGQEVLFQIGNEGLGRIQELIPDARSLPSVERYALRRAVEVELHAQVSLRHIRENRKREALLSNAKIYLENMVLDSD